MARHIALVLVLAAAAGSAAGEAQTLWQIGKPDGSYMEFAIAGDYHAWEKQFAAKDPVFEVGKSDAAKDWPFIHPGPGDSWAGGRQHPFTIRFNLPDEPRGIFTLKIDLADTHGKEMPRYVVRIGERTGDFRLPPGGGDASLTDPKAGKPYNLTLILPAEAFKKGVNQVVLTCADGSWVQYDAITLLNDPDAKMPEAAVQSVTATPTPFFLRGEGGTIGRALEVSVALTAPSAEVTIRAEAGGKTVEVPVKQLASFGGVSREVVVPDSDGPIEVKVTATAGASSKTTTVTVPPQRKWRIYVAASAHTDIGYTDIQPRCAERHCQNTDMAEELAAKFPDFKWNLEVAWQAENYLASRKGEKLETFLKLAKEGRIGVQALYCNILTGLCSTEEACRLTWFAHSLKDKYGIPYRSAMISDVPTQEATIPMILAGAGIRYFSSGANNDRGYTFTRLYDKSPYWWEGPDGSRVLMTLVPGYSYADGWGLNGSVESARSRIMGALKGYEARKDYPYDAVFLHGAVSDNCPMNPHLADTCKAWNDRYEYPKLILCHNAEFHEYIEKNFADKLPVVKGSGGTYWEDGAGSSAKETTMVRNAHELVTAAQSLLALAGGVKKDIEYPAAAINEAWRQCLLYDEHTWGAAGSIGDPEGAGTKAQWKIKAQFAVDAAAQAQSLAAQTIKTLASLVKTDGPSLVVLNLTGSSRMECGGAMLGEGQRIAEQDATVWQAGPTSHGFVTDLPAFGYRVLKLAAAKDAAPASQPAEGATIESRFYRVEFDPATGAAKSIFDKIDNRELLDLKAPYQANQYLYVSGGDGTRIVAGGPVEPKLVVGTTENVKMSRAKLGTLGERMTVRASGPQTPSVISIVTVWNDIRRVDFFDILSKKQTYKKEGVYFAFPFAADKPVFRYEVPGGIVCANTEMLPGACYDWFTMQHFVEVESSPGGPAVTWASPDAPLVCFQDIFRGKWQSPVPMKNGHLYAYVMNNYWHTNYKAGQDGTFQFRFALTSGSKSDLPGSAAFGAGIAIGLAVVAVNAAQDGPLTGASGSLASVAEPNVRLVSAKRADKGGGLVLRLWEVAGTATVAHVKLPPMMKAAKATACNLVEEPLPQGAALEIKDGAVTVPVPSRGLATVVIE